MSFIVFVIPALTVSAVVWMIYSRRRRDPDTIYMPTRTEPFSVADYWKRLEQTTIDILEEQKPVDQTIILWWGLDGLTLDKNGELKWVSRKKDKPVNQNVSYQPCQTVVYADNNSYMRVNECQSTRAQIDELMANNVSLQMQINQSAQYAAFINRMQIQMPEYLGGSLYMQPPYLQSALVSPLTQCCCNWPR